jgi:hypothetical protein
VGQLPVPALLLRAFTFLVVGLPPMLGLQDDAARIDGRDATPIVLANNSQINHNYLT